MRVVKVGRRPVATPADWRPTVARRPARAPWRGRTSTRAIPSGANATTPPKSPQGKAGARQRDASASPSDASESASEPARGERGVRHDDASSVRSSGGTSSGRADARKRTTNETTVSSLDWNDVGPGLAPSVATACLGAFLFGYHSAVINAPLGAVAADLGFAGDNAAKGAVVSVLVAGGFLGGLGIGPLADARGRRAALLATTLPLTVGTLVSASADSFADMTVGRLITGVGVGASSQIVPLYLSEVSPPNLRGTVNGIRRVAYVIGCLLAFQAAVPLQAPPEPPRSSANPATETAKAVPAKVTGLAAAAKPTTAPDTRVADATGTTLNPKPTASSVAPPSVSDRSGASAAPRAARESARAADRFEVDSKTRAESSRTFGTDPAAAAAPTAPPPSPSPSGYPSASARVAAEGTAKAEKSTSGKSAPAESASARKIPLDANASEKTPPRAEPAFASEDVFAARAPRVVPSSSEDTQNRGTARTVSSSPSSETRASESHGPARPAADPPDGKPEKASPTRTLATKTEARLETKPVRLAPAESAKKASSSTKRDATAKKTTPVPAPGWWRPLFYWAAAPALLLALSTSAGFAVESPVWLLGPEGCAVESRRSLAKLLNLRGRAAVRWQESVSGAAGRIAVGKKRAGEVTRSADAFDADDAKADETFERKRASGLAAEAKDAIERASAGEPAARSWSVLFEDRNRQPVIIGLGLCFLAAFSGSNTVIYFASSVLQEAGLTDPNLLTTAVGVPNLLGGLVALVATDAFGRRPLLLLSFGGMSVSLAALAIASALTPGVATQSFCDLPVPSPEEFSGLPCVACDALAAICDDLPPPDALAAAGGASSLEPQRTTALVAIPAYTLLFSLGAGPVPWLLYNEVFPTRIRARATAVCTAINYASNTVVGATFLPLVSGIGLGGAYGLYAASCFAGFLFVDRFVFETKGLKLEDIEGVMAEREKRWRDE